MHHSRRNPIYLVVALTAVFSLVSCSSDDLLNPGLNFGEQSEVESASQAVTIGGPSAAAAESMIVGMMGLVTSTRAPGGASCPSTFDLGNGISGTCSSTASGATFTFGGSLMIDGASVAVNGALAVSQATNQPSAGTAYLISLDVSASGPRGDASWGTTGEVTVDGQGTVLDIDLTIMVTATSTSGFSSSVTAIVDTSRFDLTVSGPLGSVLRFELDRATMTGAVMLNGLHVADVTIVNGCASIHYTIPGMSDERVCADD